MQLALGAFAVLPIIQRGFFTPCLALHMPTKILAVPSQGLPTLQSLSLTVTREGEATDDPKFVTIFAGNEPVGSAVIANFFLHSTAGVQKFKTELLRGNFQIQASDLGAPRLGIIRWPIFTAETTSLLYNLTEGDAGSVGTVAATVLAKAVVDDSQRVREVLVVERQADGTWRIAGSGMTDSDHQTPIDLKVTPSGSCYAVGLDDFGKIFEPGAAVAAGQRIRPTVFAGYVYQVFEDGVLPTLEPAWWDDTGLLDQYVGTARATVVRYYRPLAHGPITVELS